MDILDYRIRSLRLNYHPIENFAVEREKFPKVVDGGGRKKGILRVK
jgi:hypothetical protein